jgi:predicted MPP superfamily phosphohydrolase
MDDQLLIDTADDLAAAVDTRDRGEERAREAWRQSRRRMEATRDWFTPAGRKKRPPLERTDLLIKPAGFLFRITGVSHWIFRAALDIRCTEIDLVLPGLPVALDGYRVCHLTDPHFDALPGLAGAITDACRGLAADLVAITGDLRGPESGPFREHRVIDDLGRVLAGIDARDGVLATLGNHDCEAMVGPLEALGVRVLLDEEISLRLRNTDVSVVGLDDPHRFHGPASVRCLEQLPRAAERFRLFLVHSPELASVAAAKDGDLYLCGHTHGGQICLPSGRPVLKHLHCETDLAVGLWRRGAMIGYTSPGAGVSKTLPVRLFSQSEVTLFTLRSGSLPL